MKVIMCSLDSETTFVDKMAVAWEFKCDIGTIYCSLMSTKINELKITFT